jgi:type IX secretion system PorP/SprF family membrane protein
MKNILIVTVLMLVGLTTFAQQDPYYTHFMFNRQAYNPAYSGSQGGLEATLLHHQQWVGYKDGAGPSTQALGVNLPVGNHGIGIQLVNDKLGFEKSVNAVLSYNYRINIGSGTLGVGPGIGLMQKSIDGTKLTPEQANDLRIPNSNVSSIKPDFTFGLFYQNLNLNNLYVGLSAVHLSEEDFNYDATPGAVVQYNGRRHYYLTAGMQFEMTPMLAFRPNVLTKYDGATTQFDVNADFLYNQKFRGGLSYRTGDAMSVLIGYYFTQNLHLGYSYDYTLTKIRSVSSGTHELVLNYVLKTNKKPRAIYKKMILSPRTLE